MKILGIVGSPRKNGNSFYLTRQAINGAKQALPNLVTEILQLGELNIQSCRACESCADKPFNCVMDDDLGLVLNKMKDAEGILIAAPRYGPFGAGPSKLQALLERLLNISYLPKHNDPEFIPPLKDKFCGLLAVSVEGGQNNLPVLHSLEQYVLAYRMRVIHTTNWPFVGVCAKGNEKGDVLKDENALNNAQALGRRLAENLKSDK